MTPPIRLLPFLLAGLAFAPGARSADPVAVPRFTHPGAGQTIYILMPDRFANGSRENDTGRLPGGAEETGFDPTRIGYFHGGDFPGLTAKLDYIQGLNVTTIWTTPPFRNNPVQRGSAGYHGYWITDFLNVDPHLGTNAEYREFLRQAHAHSLRVYLDIVVNHTGDIIQYAGGKYDYIDTKTTPTRDASGRPFDERAVAYNGLNDPAAFPALSADRSFPYRPVVPPGLEHIKNPDWLNDVTLYHNRGNSAFTGESSTRGDFVGLDDLMTEHPRVVRGFIDVFGRWLDWGVDGFRIDTMRHVNAAFWQAFNPAMRAKARALGRPDFLQFGEVMNGTGDVTFLSEFSTNTMAADSTTDFAFATAARNFVSQGGPAAALEGFFFHDDLYTDHDSNVHSSVTLLGNYDIGRWGYFLLQDNPGAAPGRLADLVRLGHGLMYLSRGMPVLHYGDEQGMLGRGGNDMQAREDMFASRAPDYRDAPLLATTRTGADDKFDPAHPFYQFFAKLGALRAAHPALRTGAMLLRDSGQPGLFAFSRIERGEKVEYLVALNNSRREKLTASLPTSQPAGAGFRLLFDSRTGVGSDATLTADAAGRVSVELDPLQFAVWRAAAPLAAPAGSLRVALVNPADGATLSFGRREFDDLLFPSRQELRAEVGGGDGFAEVTFTMQRASRPGQYELLGTDDAAPYRVFWSPPSDLAPGEQLTFTATVTDLRGHTAAASISGVKVAPVNFPFGIAGATVPFITAAPASATVRVDEPVTLRVAAEGTGPLEYQWLRNDEEVVGATEATLTFKASPSTGGSYRALVRNRAGTTLSQPAAVTLLPAFGRIESHSDFPSKLVSPRRVEVWLPPGYDENPAARYPVIYMHDGQNVFTNGTGFGGSTWETDRAMQKLLAAKTARPAIIVAIWNTGLGRYPEYMPQKAVTGDTVTLHKGAPTMPASAIRSDAYLKFIVGELKPFIDRTYRTRPEQPHTFVMGSSMGGLISAYALAEYPSVFCGAGCVSTHWPAGDGCVIDWLAKNLPKPGANRIWFDYGTATLDALYEPYQLRMDAAISAAGYTAGREWITQKFEGAEHSEKSWRERVHLPLAFLLKD